jgi:hypothetical protein
MALLRDSKGHFMSNKEDNPTMETEVQVIAPPDPGEPGGLDGIKQKRKYTRHGKPIGRPRKPVSDQPESPAKSDNYTPEELKDLVCVIPSGLALKTGCVDLALDDRQAMAIAKPGAKLLARYNISGEFMDWTLLGLNLFNIILEKWIVYQMWKAERADKKKAEGVISGPVTNGNGQTI